MQTIVDNNKPLVSIGIPTFNRPEGLLTAIRCIQNQTYENLEIIVSDNCTPGEEISRLMAQLMKEDKRIQYFRQRKNIGATNNFDFLLSKAAGKYFAWAADDDLCKEQFVEKIVATMEEHPDIALCTCDIENIDENDTLMEISRLESIRISASWMDTRKLFFHYPTSNIFFCIYGIYRTKSLKDCGIEILRGWRGIPIDTETPFLAKYSRWGRIAAIPDVLKTYRRHSTSVYYSAVSKTNGLDKFMIRLSIRLHLGILAIASGGPLRNRMALLHSVLHSFVETMNLKRRAIACIPKKIRTWMKTVTSR